MDEARGATAPRLRVRMLGPASAAESQRDAAFLRLVSVAEAYVDVLQMTLLMRELANPSAVMLQLLDAIETDATSNWVKRKDAFWKYHRIDLSTCPRWKELQIATRVRNCLAHALGGITPRYRTRSRFAIDLATIGVGVGGGRVHVTKSSIDVLGDVARDFIAGLDRET